MSIVLRKLQCHENSDMFKKQNKYEFKQTLKSFEQIFDENVQSLSKKFPEYSKEEIEQFLDDCDNSYEVVLQNLKKKQLKKLQQKSVVNNQHVGNLQNIFKNLSLKKQNLQSKFDDDNLKLYSSQLIDQLKNQISQENAIQYLYNQMQEYKTFIEQKQKEQVDKLEEQNNILKQAYRKQCVKIEKQEFILKEKVEAKKDNQQFQNKIAQLNIENFNLKLRLQMLDQNQIFNYNQQIQ